MTPADIPSLVAEWAKLHEDARGCTFDLAPADGPIARLTLFMHKNGDALLDALSPKEDAVGGGELSVLVEALHDRLFGVASHDDPALALKEISDGGGIHEVAHSLLRALPPRGAVMVVDPQPEIIGDPICKIVSYNQSHEEAVEMGYPSVCEALEHLDELRTPAVEGIPAGMVVDTGGETVVEIARRALLNTEHAHTGVVNPVNGTAAYSYVTFHGERVEFSDGQYDLPQERDAGSGQAAAYAQKINDGLFELAKKAAGLAYTPVRPTSDNASARERPARIIDPVAWEQRDRMGDQGSLRLRVAESLAKASEILAALPTTDRAKGERQALLQVRSFITKHGVGEVDAFCAQRLHDIAMDARS